MDGDELVAGRFGLSWCGAGRRMVVRYCRFMVVELRGILALLYIHPGLVFGLNGAM